MAADDRPYVAFALRPRLPARTRSEARDYIVVVDSSHSMMGERFQRASRLASAVISEMDRRDRLAGTFDVAAKKRRGVNRSEANIVGVIAALWELRRHEVEATVENMIADSTRFRALDFPVA